MSALHHRQDAAPAAGDHRAPRHRAGAALRLHHRQSMAGERRARGRPVAELHLRSLLPLPGILLQRMAAGCPSHDDPLRHLQRAVAVPVLLPALHTHQGRPLLHHRSLPDPGGAVCDEWRCHLHSEAHGLAPSLGKHLLRLRLHPGVAGLPPGPGQRHHLRHPAEARVTPRDVAAGRGQPRRPRSRRRRGRIDEETEKKINQKTKKKKE